MNGGWNKGLIQTDWDEKVRIKYNGTFKLVSIGETNEKSERYLIVECLSCGTQKRVSSNSFKGECGKHGHCDVCSDKRSDIVLNRARKTRSVECKIRHQKEKLKAEKEKNNRKLKKNQIGLKLCDCGMAFIPQNRKACDECKRKTLRAIEDRKATKRRLKIKESDFDSDITVEETFKRYKGICYLCGRTCDWNDYKIIKGNKVVGGSYPTREHVIALCNGGAHTWDNVKLACHACNSKKGRKLLAG